MHNPSILIVDDEVSYLNALQSFLEQEGYKNVYTVPDPLQVMPLLTEQRIDLIICDVYMPVLNGLELLEKIMEHYPDIPVIMVTAIDEVDIALQAIRLGAYEYITKPPDTDRLLLTIRRGLEHRMQSLERDALISPPPPVFPAKKNFDNIITGSKLMYKVFELVEIYAPTNETILITGETGTGKDLIAKKIHDLSSRFDKPFVAVNLASMSAQLFESELFGHERGSFTGAQTTKIGFFEAANGGTIFLDEIGELSADLQGKLLRTIQYSEIYRIGSAKPVKLDIRIVAATNKDLVQSVKNNQFRADLYYRLKRGYINLPPLRDREDDIIKLAHHFLKIGNYTYRKSVPSFSTSVINDLRSYPFPGNIRELENLILNTVARHQGNEEITSIDIPVSSETAPSDNKKIMTLAEAEVEYVKYIMEYTGNKVSKAAYILGISERTLQRKLQQYKNNR